MKHLLFLAALLITTAASAKITLPDIVSDNMVLQHSTQAALWGHAAPKSEVKITVSWNNTLYTTKADKDGAWIIKVDTPAASYDIQSLTISDKDDTKELKNILNVSLRFGSGESNMEMPMMGFNDAPVNDADRFIALSTQQKYVRMAKVPKHPALTPLEQCPGKWEISSPETTAWFSATGYFFSLMLQQVLDVPVGFINCSWGGASVEGWSPKELLQDYSDVDIDNYFNDFVAPEEGWQWSYTYPMIMYNGMLHPLRNYTIKGFVWYQGCSNVGKHDVYPERLARMVEHWRGLFGQGELPFYQVEIAPYIWYGDSGARFRECQHKACALIPNSGIITTNDLVDPDEYDNIHPANKQGVGERLAYLVINKTYGHEGIIADAPKYVRMEVEGSTAMIFFDNTTGFSPWHSFTGFEIAGEDRVFYPANATLNPGEDKIKVSAEQVSSPVAVRYCFRDFLIGNLTGSRHNPVHPFRTDDWDWWSFPNQ